MGSVEPNACKIRMEEHMMDNNNDWNRAKSPVFWGALCSLIAAEIVKLADNFSWWNLALAVFTVGAGAFAALNTPTNKYGF